MINVCVLSKYPIAYVRTNIQVPDPVTKEKLFSRDCLEVEIALKEGGDTALTLFANHFKSQLARSPEEKQRGKEKRGRQVDWVANMLKQRYGPDLRGGEFAVLGDFNANYDAEELQSLLRLNGLQNIVRTRPLKVPGQDVVTDADRWTHYFEGDNTTSQLDYILLSPTLAEKSAQEGVTIEKRGLADYVKQYTGQRFPGVGPRDSEASDHCAVFTTLQL
jgi:endonuclease/exonuclease/phosphatase family metal-dependent hydrolase